MLDGDPAGLRVRAEVQRGAAEAFGAAAELLRTSARDDIALAVAATREQTVLLATDLEAAQQAQHETASALAEYAARLEIAKQRADEADALRGWTETERVESDDRLGRLEWSRSTALADPGASDLAALEHQIAAERERSAWLARLRAEAEEDYRAAELERDVAAEAAIARLDCVGLDTTEGRWLDPLSAFEALAEGIAGHLRPLDSALRKVIDPLSQSVELTVGALSESLLIVGMLTLGGGLLLSAVGPIGLPMAASIAGLLSAFIVASINSDVRAPTPTVRRLGVGAGGPMRRSPGTVADALSEAAEVDALGLEDRTVTKITEVTGTDGVVRWRVVLPSTQEWGTRLSDAGAVNDFDSNLALLLAPTRQTQYERGVLEAMQQAGIGADDPVLLVGFSQGGIMAGHLAAHRDGHNWAGVIAAGAPIGAMPIPAPIEVVSVEHLGDPVTRLELDFGAAGPDRAGWSTISDASAGSLDGLPGIHNVAQYGATLQRHTDGLARRHPGLAEFYADEDRSRSRYYTWQE